MDDEELRQQAKDTLEPFLEEFNKYVECEATAKRGDHHVAVLLDSLLRQEQKVSQYLGQILGDKRFMGGWLRGSIHMKDLVSNVLLPGNLNSGQSFVTGALNQAIGALDDKLWPRSGPDPVLVIKDARLRDRCYDLLSAERNYDRALREATTVLEHRLREKCGHDLLSKLIPLSSDQTATNLVQTLLKPGKLVLYISQDEREREAFYAIMRGVVLYLRNHPHHTIDDAVELSWAWAVVSLIDRLLTDIDNCTVLPLG